MNTISRHSRAHQTLGEIPAWERRVAYRRLMSAARLRGWVGKPAAGDSNRTLIARLADGPLAGSTREVAAVEGRPPKTIDLELGARTVRYCLSEWEQSGHTAVYGFLYEV